MEREYAIKKFREHWMWLSDNVLKEKRDFPFKFEKFETWDYCFLCEYATIEDKPLDCALCLVEWGKTGMYKCGNGLYKHYSWFVDGPCGTFLQLLLPSGLSKIYKRISELPEVEK